MGKACRAFTAHGLQVTGARHKAEEHSRTRITEGAPPATAALIPRPPPPRTAGPRLRPGTASEAPRREERIRVGGIARCVPAPATTAARTTAGRAAPRLRVRRPIPSGRRQVNDPATGNAD